MKTVLQNKGGFFLKVFIFVVLVNAAELAVATEISALEGTIEKACAPYDGPAFLSVIEQKNGSTIRLTGMGDISQSEGVWAITPKAKPGQGTASLCNIKSPNEPLCAVGMDGHFSIKVIGENQSQVTYSIMFPRGEYVSLEKGSYLARRINHPMKERRSCR